MNRRGLEPISFFGFFLLLIILASGIIWGISVFYGKGYDYRSSEAQTLADLTVPCLYTIDFFAEGFSLEQCGINVKVVSESHLVYVRRLSDNKEFYAGVLDYKNQCFLNHKSVAYPRCVSSSVSARGERYEVIVGTNQRSRSVAHV